MLTDGLELLHHGKAFAPHLLLQRLVVQAEHLLEGDVRNELGEAVCVAQRQFHDARRVADGRLGGHGAVGNDLGHLIRAVLVNHIVNDPAPPLVVEVDVNIGEAHTVWVQEPLEQQIVLDRVDVGDADAIRHCRTRGRPPSWPHAHPHLSGGRGEVLHNQEVPGVARALDGLQLEVDALPNLVRDFLVPLFCTEVREVPQVCVLAPLAAVLGVFFMHELGRDVKRRQQHVALQHIPLASFHQRCDVRDRLRNVREQLLHILWRFQVEAVVGETKPELPTPLADVALGLADVAGVLDAKQDVVGVALVLARVIAVVARHEFHVVRGGQTFQYVVDHGLFFKTVPVQLGIEVGAHEVLPKQERLFRLGLANVQDERRHFAKQSPCEDDQIFLVLLDKGPVDPRHVIESVGVGLGGQLGEVVVAVLVLGKEHGWIPVVLDALVVHVAADVQFRPHNGLDALFVARPNKLKRRHHVAVVRHGQSGHAHVLGGRDQLTHGAYGLQHAELGMHV